MAVKDANHSDTDRETISHKTAEQSLTRRDAELEPRQVISAPVRQFGTAGLTEV